MYSLNTLHKVNAEACKAPARESETTRHCSYNVTVLNGKRNVILHSALRRSTACLEGRRATIFLTNVQGLNSAEARDAVIESYFSSIPTGKQTKAKARG